MTSQCVYWADILLSIWAQITKNAQTLANWTTTTSKHAHFEVHWISSIQYPYLQLRCITLLQHTCTAFNVNITNCGIHVIHEDVINCSCHIINKRFAICNRALWTRMPYRQVALAFLYPSDLKIYWRLQNV